MRLSDTQVHRTKPLVVGANQEWIVAQVSELMEDEENYRSMARAHNPDGDGQACERIVEVLKGI